MPVFGVDIFMAVPYDRKPMVVHGEYVFRGD